MLNHVESQDFFACHDRVFADTEEVFYRAAVQAFLSSDVDVSMVQLLATPIDQGHGI